MQTMVQQMRSLDNTNAANIAASRLYTNDCVCLLCGKDTPIDYGASDLGHNFVCMDCVNDYVIRKKDTNKDYTADMFISEYVCAHEPIWEIMPFEIFVEMLLNRNEQK